MLAASRQMFPEPTTSTKNRPEVQESEDLFLKAFRISPDCVSIVRVADRKVIMANEALCRLWGRTPEEVTGRLSSEYSSWLSEDARVAFMQTLQDEGECLDQKTAVRLHDGRQVWFNISSRLITTHGEACVLSVMRDITEE